MKIFVFFAISLLVKVEVISSQKDCWLFDFNDATVISDFTRCIPGNLGTLILKSYNASVEPTPFRPNSTYYLSAPDTPYIQSCSQSQPFGLRGNRNITLEIAYNLRNSDYPQTLISVSFFTLQSNELRHLYTTRGFTHTQNWSIQLITFFVSYGVEDIVFLVYARDLSPGDFAAIEYIKISADNSTCVPEKTFCKTIDFDQPLSSQTLSDFANCEDLHLPALTIKSYKNSTISPYRESATFHLSSQTEGMSCLQLSKVLTLDTNSRISSAIYLNNLWPGAWVEVFVYDKVTRDRQVVLLVESSSNEWRSLVGSVNRKFDNAQIFIQTNAQIHNALAIEFLNITRTDDKCSTG